MIVFFKGMIFLFVNTSIGYLFFFPIKFFLFMPKKTIKIKNRKIPFTPGFLYRKKIKFYNKIKDEIEQFLNDTKDYENQKSRIAKWENMAYEKTWNKIDSSNKFEKMPDFLKNTIKQYISIFVFELTRQFLRDFIPWLEEKYEIENKFEIISDKIDIEILEKYFDSYIYRFFKWPAVIVGFLVGIVNAVFFWIFV